MKLKITRQLLLRIFNFVLFYLGWGFSLSGVVRGHPYEGPIIVGCFLLYHLVQLRFHFPEILLLLTVGLFGTLNDTIYLNTGLIVYNGGYESVPWLAPLWVTGIWMLFAMSVNHSLTWLRYHLLLAAVCGAGGGAVSYYAAARVGAAAFHPNDLVVTLIIGAVWFFIMPILILYSSWLTRRF